MTAEIPGVDHRKFFVLMGYDPDTREALGFLINSPGKLPALAKKNIVIKDFQLVVPKSGHPFLKYDSLLNCFSIEGIDFFELVNALIESPSKMCGNLKEDLLKEVEEAVETNPTFSMDDRNLLTGAILFPDF